MKRLAALLIGWSIAFALTAQTIVIIDAVPTPGGIVSSKFRDGDDSGAAPPTTPQLGTPIPINDDEADVVLATPCTGGSAPLTYELQFSITSDQIGFTVLDADADFDTDGVLRITGLVELTQYWLQLACVDNAARRSGNSTVVTFTTLAAGGGIDVTAPSVPTGLSCTSTVATQISCTWTASTDAVGVTTYNVLRGDGDGAGNPVGSGSIIATLNGTPPVTSYTDTGLTASTEYYHRISAGDLAGNVSALTSRDFTTVISGGGPPPGGDSDTPDYVDPVAGVTLLGGRTSSSPSSNGALSVALANASCGETINIASGTYTGTFTMTTSCAANNPVILKGAASFATTINGTLNVAGARNIITGIEFTGSSSSVRLCGTNNKLVGNRLGNASAVASKLVATGSVTGYAGCAAGQTGAEIAYNGFVRPTGVTSSNTFAIKSDATVQNMVPLNVWVHHNDFNGGQDAQGPDTDPMEPGNGCPTPWCHTHDSGWYVEDNLIRNYSDCNQNAIDMKFSSSVIRRNTVNGSCTVKFSQRHGSFGIFESNWLEPGTIQTSGEENIVVCNRAAIRVQAGEEVYGFTGKDADGRSPHNASHQTLVESNNGTLTVGYQAGPEYDVAATATIIRNHTGGITLVSGGHSGTTNTPTAAATYECADPVELTTSDVGTGALSSASAAYKAARGL